MYALGDARVDACAGDRQAVFAVAVDEVERRHVAVPQVFRVEEQRLGVLTEVFKEIVARADGDAGHRGVGKARDAVGDLVDRAVAAAGVKADIVARLRDRARQSRRVPARLGEHALNVQIVISFQRLGHRVDALTAVLLPRCGVDDKNVLQEAHSYAVCYFQYTAGHLKMEWAEC